MKRFSEKLLRSLLSALHSLLPLHLESLTPFVLSSQWPPCIKCAANAEDFYRHLKALPLERQALPIPKTGRWLPIERQRRRFWKGAQPYRQSPLPPCVLKRKRPFFLPACRLWASVHLELRAEVGVKKVRFGGLPRYVLLGWENMFLFSFWGDDDQGFVEQRQDTGGKQIWGEKKKQQERISGFTLNGSTQSFPGIPQWVLGFPTQQLTGRVKVLYGHVRKLLQMFAKPASMQTHCWRLLTHFHSPLIGLGWHLM